MKLFSIITQFGFRAIGKSKLSKNQIVEECSQAQFSAMEHSNGSRSLTSQALDWDSVNMIVENAALQSAPSFDLFISRKEGREFSVRIEAESSPETPVKIPVRIPAGLYDLAW